MKLNEWGSITWIFLHTLAEKIKENEFEKIRIDVINIIILICNNLPCPDCAKHASEVLKVAYLSNIKSKKHLIEFLRQFHNIVNIKLKKNEFTREDIKDKYKNNNLLLLFNNMINVYKSIKTSERLMTYNMQRNKNLNKVISNINNIKDSLE
tara:strand:+ start:385 stop:840 length:456 start_codon:yes stop_codon:yes gene_type:complete